MGDLSAVRGALNHGKRAKRYVLAVKAAGLKANEPVLLASRVLTGTSQASASTWEGHPEGRNLAYGPGHSPQGTGEVEAVLRAAGVGGTVGWVHDAKAPGGFLYGFKIGVPEEFRGGFARQNAAISRAMREEWAKTKGATS